MAAQTKAAQAAKKTTKPAAKKAASASTKSAAKSATKSAPSKKAAKAPAKKAAAKAPVKKAAAKAPVKTSAAKAAKKTAAKPAAVTSLSKSEMKAFEKLIRDELETVRREYAESLAAIDELRLGGHDGAGEDAADAGTKTFEREQEMSIANNRLDLISQMERALGRISAGTYGLCESCGEQIPSARLEAFPSATLCVKCKTREERR